VQNSVKTQTDVFGVLDLDWENEKNLIARPPLKVEREANHQMVQLPPPPPSPLLPSQPPLQPHPATDSEVEPRSKDIDYTDGYGLFHVGELIDFIKELTYHTAGCGGVFNMEGTNFKNGAGITQKWKCSCNETFTHRNCKWIKTDIP